MKSLLIFIPKKFYKEKSGYIYGKVIYDANSDVRKFYIIGVCNMDNAYINKSTIHFIGYYFANDNIHEVVRKHSDWINIRKHCNNMQRNINYDYYIQNVIINDKPVSIISFHIVLIIYDQLALQQSELLNSKATTGDHFYELMKILQSNDVKRMIKKDNYLTHAKEIFLMYLALLFFYPISIFTKVMHSLLPILKYSSLGLHMNECLNNMKWLCLNIIQYKRFTLKTGNYVFAVLIDIILGILILQILLYIIGDTPPSEILLNNTEKVVEFLKNLINWLMGAPAGLKLNYAFNNMLGKFFLYHIHLWWTFLIFMKPVMDFTFNVLLLFGKLGVTFQISIAADLLALMSFHIYCIYVYAARLFNTQLHGLVALFRLFLGKKKNPLRERVDSCQYQSDQLFVGTLLFTILLFLMPTTWVYYTVFTLLRLMLISLSGFLIRLKFCLQILPVYTFFKWLFRSHSMHSIVDIKLHTNNKQGITLIMSLVVPSWKQTWKNCLPDIVTRHPPIEWNMIFKHIIWGQLLYP